MRLFQAKILDDYLEGTTGSLVTSAAWSCLLARAESLKFTCLADQVSGPPTVRIDLLGSNSDGTGEFTKNLLLDTAIAAGMVPMATYGPGDTTYPPPRHLIVWARTTAGSGKAHLQIWVCGRGPQLLEAIPPTAASFGAQYAAARMMADEDNVALKKQALRPGASLFYPPELYDPRAPRKCPRPAQLPRFRRGDGDDLDFLET